MCKILIVRVLRLRNSSRLLEIKSHGHGGGEPGEVAPLGGYLYGAQDGLAGVFRAHGPGREGIGEEALVGRRILEQTAPEGDEVLAAEAVPKVHRGGSA